MTTSVERIHRAAYAAVAHAIEADLTADVAANLAVAREVLTILEERLEGKWPVDPLPFIRQLQAELTPSEESR